VQKYWLFDGARRTIRCRLNEQTHETITLILPQILCGGATPDLCADSGDGRHLCSRVLLLLQEELRNDSNCVCRKACATWEPCAPPLLRLGGAVLRRLNRIQGDPHYAG
jgi:hypothetical protein